MIRLLLAITFLLAAIGTTMAQPVSRYAVLVGIGEYPKESKWPRLHADADAQKMKALIRKKGFLDANIELLTNEQATYQSIRLALNKIYRNAEPEDQVFLYLSGHSQQITDRSGDEEDHLDEAFVPYDAQPRYMSSVDEGGSHLLDDEIGNWVSLISEKVTRLGSVFVFYDGGLTSNKKPAIGQKGVMPVFKIPEVVKKTLVDSIRNFDNDWLDISYTIENNQVVTLDPGAPAGCPNLDIRLADGKYGSGLVAGFIATTEKIQSGRFRDLNRSLRQMSGGCNFRLDGALQQEIFPKAADRQFVSATETDIEDQKSQIYSVVIGVSKYQNVDPLQYGDADASLFHSILVSQNGTRIKPENQFLFIDSNATIKPIIDAMEEISKKVKEGDLIYFFFAGHGDVENLLSRKAHLLLYNSPANVYKAGGTLPVEYIKDYFQQWIYRKARVFLVVDACKSGKLAGGLEGGSAAVSSLKEVGANSARLLSCQPNEKSEESDEFGGGHGAFTYYMVKGLMGMANTNGDEKISIQEIGSFIADSVSIATERHQNPMVEGNQKLTFLPLVNVLPPANSAVVQNPMQASRINGNSTDDSLKARWVRELRKHLSSKIFVEPANNCAKATFNRISNTFPLDGRFLKIVAQEVQLAIDKKSQSLINAYIQGNELVATEEAFSLASRELHFLLDITQMSDPLYFMYLSRSYFFEGRSIQPVLVDNDLNRYKLKKAIRNLRSSLSYEPEGAQNHNAIGRLQQVNRQYTEAISSYKKAIALAPAWKFPINNLATVFDEYALASNNNTLTDSAVYYYHRALVIDPKFVVAYKNLGKVYFNKGLYTQAKNQYRQALILNPNYPEAYQNLGDVYRQEQKWDSAVFYLTKGLNINPTHPDLMTNLGNVYFDQVASNPDLKEKLLNEASTWYRQAIRQNQLCQDALLGLGHIFWEKNQYDSSVYYYRLVVTLDSTALHQNYLIEGLLRGGKLVEAEKRGMKLAKSHPFDAMNWFDLGVLAVLKNNPKLAVTRFQKSIGFGLKDKSIYADEPLLQSFIKSKDFAQLQKLLK